MSADRHDAGAVPAELPFFLAVLLVVTLVTEIFIALSVKAVKYLHIFREMIFTFRLGKISNIFSL